MDGGSFHKRAGGLTGRGTPRFGRQQGHPHRDGFKRGQYPGSNIPDFKQRPSLSRRIATSDRRGWHEGCFQRNHRARRQAGFRSRQAEPHGNPENRRGRLRRIRELFHIQTAGAVLLAIAVLAAFRFLRIGGSSDTPARQQNRIFNEANTKRRSRCRDQQDQAEQQKGRYNASNHGHIETAVRGWRKTEVCK